MSMLIGLVGLPNSGKSTTFKALTLANVQIANYPFTTITPNTGVAYLIRDCPCKRLGVRCNPQNSKCVGGKRWIPVRLLDVAGLVEGAHEGRGLGNKFLDDLRQADGLIHVLDASGLTDAEGKERPASDRWDPEKSIAVLETEIDEWLYDVIKRNSEKLEGLARMKKIPLERLLAEKLSGLGMTEDSIKRASLKAPVGSREFATILRKETKPMVVCANKIDRPGAHENYERMKKSRSNMVPSSAESELALREAAEHGLIEYTPGAGSFSSAPEKLSSGQQKALDFIRQNVLEKYGSTGVQKALDTLVFSVLGCIAVYPVANMGKYSDTKGNVLPDVFLVPKGTTMKELAGKVHSAMADKFIGGIGVDRKKLGADHVLSDGDVVEILFGK